MADTKTTSIQDKIDIISQCPNCKEYFIKTHHKQIYCKHACRLLYYRKNGLIKTWRNKYYRTLIERLFEYYGCQCFICQKTKNLEFAHIQHTPILDKFPNGGRPREKYHDIDNNKHAYRLLCYRHHKEFDNTNKTWIEYKNDSSRNVLG